MFGLVTADNIMVLFVFWESPPCSPFLLHLLLRTKLAAQHHAAGPRDHHGRRLAMLVAAYVLDSGRDVPDLRRLAAAPEMLGSTTIEDVAVVLVLAGVVASPRCCHALLAAAAVGRAHPVSAYLRAAAMVKAGMYLVARLAGFAQTQYWLRSRLTPLGLGAMIFGGWVALRQYDLKLILAYGTVSQLGFITAVVSFGTAEHGHGGHGHGHGPRPVQQPLFPRRGCDRPPGRDA
ncbi:proton-conducting transporter membrane subunit [Kocuria rhizophila]|nr:proton-conducting transporter membrane subunit [Kocuria rhizophila]